jgi:predicted ATPase
MSLENGRYVVTGGPGAGKTSLLASLADAGHRTMPEAGRAIIAAHRAIGGPAGHNRDRHLYAELMLGWDMRSHDEAGHAEGPVFFDRGVGDLIGYLRLVGEAVPGHFVMAARRCRYADPVFLAPFWPEIFVNDDLRAQDIAEARATGEAVAGAWRELGYRIVELPKAGIAARRDFVLSTIAE